MKRNTVQGVLTFIFKYIWLFCVVLSILEVGSTAYSAKVLMQQTTMGVMQAVSGEVSGRVDGVLRLLEGLAGDARISDVSQPLFDRAILARPYQNSYDLYMVALTDEDVNVISADETEPPKENFSLSFRPYMQELYATGEYQITDAMVAGADNVTMNYTIAVPILSEGKVAGSVFGSIYFGDISDTLARNSDSGNRHFYLFGKENTLMAGNVAAERDQTFLELSTTVHYFGATREEIDQDFTAGNSGSFWEWGANGLCYVAYERVPPTEWTILYQAEYMPSFLMLLPMLLFKITFFVLLSGFFSVFGRRYLNRQFSAVNHLLDKVTSMQRELFSTDPTDKPDFEGLLNLTQQGLTDHLTGLATRAVLLSKLSSHYLGPDRGRGVLLYVDLDDLKRINDNFGHEAGDLALLHFAQALKRVEQERDAVAARYGGDEFVLVVNAVEEKEAAAIAQALCRQFNTTLTLKDHTFSIHGSIGLSLYPEDGVTPEDLLCRADLALYSAKQHGKNQYQFYEA